MVQQPKVYSNSSLHACVACVGLLAFRWWADYQFASRTAAILSWGASLLRALVAALYGFWARISGHDHYPIKAWFDDTSPVAANLKTEFCWSEIASSFSDAELGEK